MVLSARVCVSHYILKETERRIEMFGWVNTNVFFPSSYLLSKLSCVCFENTIIFSLATDSRHLKEKRSCFGLSSPFQFCMSIRMSECDRDCKTPSHACQSWPKSKLRCTLYSWHKKRLHSLLWTSWKISWGHIAQSDKQQSKWTANISQYTAIFNCGGYYIPLSL